MPAKIALGLLLVASLGLPVAAQKQQADWETNATELQQPQLQHVDWEAKQFTIELKQLGDPEINRMLPEIYETIKSGRVEAPGRSKETSAGQWKSMGAKSGMMWLWKDPKVRREIEKRDSQYEAGHARGMDTKSKTSQQGFSQSSKGERDDRTARLEALRKMMDRERDGVIASRSSARNSSDEKDPSNSKQVDPLVAEFGDPSVLGFGVDLEAAQTPQSRHGVGKALGSSRSSDRQSRPGDGETSSNGDGGDDRFQRIAQSMMVRLDKNGNGVLDKPEWEGMRGKFTPADANKDGRLTVEEITKWMAERMGGKRDAGTLSKRGASSSSESSSENSSRSYRLLTAHERLGQLDEVLPSWFLEKDANRDGQLAMAEYATYWTDPIARDFVSYDRNNDGVLTPQECLEGPFEQENTPGIASSNGSEEARTVKTTNGARVQSAGNVPRSKLPTPILQTVGKTPRNKLPTSISPAILKDKGYSDEKIKWYYGEMKRKKAAGKKAAGKF